MTAESIQRRTKTFSPKELLLPYQAKWVNDKARFKMGVWSRQTGKSFSTAAETIEDCLSDEGTMWVTLSAGERQALEWMEKAKMWAEGYELAIDDYSEDRDGPETLIKAAEIRFGNGSRCVAVPANPKTARGYSANVNLDEFAYHEDPDAIWRAMYPSISNSLKRQYKLRIVSTFNGKGNKFYNLWEKDNSYSKHMVTIHDAVAGGLPVDVEELREGLDDPEGWAQEYECDPLDGSNVLLPYDLISLAECADATEYNSVPDVAVPGRVLGIDFGRQHDPSVSWMLDPFEGQLLMTREILVLKKMDTPSQQDILRSRIRTASRVSFDYTGPGIGLGDYLVKEFGEWNPAKHQFGKIELCTFTVAFKRDIFPKFRKAFEAPTRIRVPISRNVREDLHAMQQVVRNGQYDYWAPRTKEGHSDRCTAGALAVHAAADAAGKTPQMITL